MIKNLFYNQKFNISLPNVYVDTTQKVPVAKLVFSSSKRIKKHLNIFERS